MTIRPIQADDTERLQLSHDRLSPESRYRRFMSAKPHLTAADARYLVDLGRLADAAVTRGVERFRAAMLTDNVAIHRLVGRFAGTATHRTRSGNLSEVEFELPTRREVPALVFAMIAAWDGS